MTIGFAATILTPNTAGFFLAADCRYSTPTSYTDTGIKTHALDKRTGAVVAGNALSVASSVEITRGIADDHNRLQPESPINFYSTVRLFSYFLDQIQKVSPWSEGSEVVLAGFLTNGSPALAKIVTRPSQRTEVHIHTHRTAGTLFLFVGKSDAKELIFAAVEQALRVSGQDWIQRALGTIAYLCEHEGESTIGGAPAVAVCDRDGVLHWPFVVMHGRTFLRGFDITEMSPASPPFPGDERLHVDYDQHWHAHVDQARPDVPVKPDDGFASISWYVDQWVAPGDAFNWKVDPDALTQRPDFESPPSIIGITRPGELSCTRAEEAILGLSQ